jgi:hypothetical protein
LPTFDGVWCIPTENNFFNYYYYFFGLISFIGIFILFIKNRKLNKANRKSVPLFVVGIECFLFLFLSLDFLASYLVDNGYTTNYDLAPYGLFGMIVFIGFLALIIVKFKAFNIKAYGAQILVFTQIALIGSQFFFLESGTAIILAAITLVVTSIIGINLMRSVKKEILQREHIEKLAGDLEKANLKLTDANEKLNQMAMTSKRCTSKSVVPSIGSFLNE